jgi:hypothetical protein
MVRLGIVVPADPLVDPDDPGLDAVQAPGIAVRART